jgi:hypothetical protein
MPLWHIFKQNCGVEPNAEAVPPSLAPAIHHSTSAFIGLGPIYISKHSLFVVWVEPILPLTLVKEPDHTSYFRMISDPFSLFLVVPVCSKCYQV